MEFSWMQNTPPFYYMLRASGQGEVWQDFTDEAKFGQYGWRCSTNEDAYSNGTLTGNWSEERFDTRRAKALRRPLPSQVGIATVNWRGINHENSPKKLVKMFTFPQFSHYYSTTYASSFNKEQKSPIYSSIKKESGTFSGHQPELDPPHIMCVPTSCYMMDFDRKGPVVGKTNASSSQVVHCRANRKF